MIQMNSATTRLTWAYPGGRPVQIPPVRHYPAVRPPGCKSPTQRGQITLKIPIDESQQQARARAALSPFPPGVSDYRPEMSDCSPAFLPRQLLPSQATWADTIEHPLTLAPIHQQATLAQLRQVTRYLWAVSHRSPRSIHRHTVPVRAQSATDSAGGSRRRGIYKIGPDSR